MSLRSGGRVDSRQSGLSAQGYSQRTGGSARLQGAAAAPPLHWAGAEPLANRAECSRRRRPVRLEGCNEAARGLFRVRRGRARKTSSQEDASDGAGITSEAASVSAGDGQHVGLAGLEPAPSSLSEIDRKARHANQHFPGPGGSVEAEGMGESGSSLNLATSDSTLGGVRPTMPGGNRTGSQPGPPGCGGSSTVLIRFYSAWQSGIQSPVRAAPHRCTSILGSSTVHQHRSLKAAARLRTVL